MRSQSDDLTRLRRFTAYGSAVLLVRGVADGGDGGRGDGGHRAAGHEYQGTVRPRLGVAVSIRSAFPAKPKIDNQWLTLKPGNAVHHHRQVISPDGTTARTVVSTVTGLTKVIDGVKTIAVWDRDYSDGELVESELAFFAQTKEGTSGSSANIRRSTRTAKLVGAPSTFISGIDKARAGIAMQASRTGTPAYVQAYAPTVTSWTAGTCSRRTSESASPRDATTMCW